MLIAGTPHVEEIEDEDLRSSQPGPSAFTSTRTGLPAAAGPSNDMFEEDEEDEEMEDEPEYWNPFSYDDPFASNPFGSAWKPEERPCAGLCVLQPHTYVLYRLSLPSVEDIYEMRARSCCFNPAVAAQCLDLASKLGRLGRG